MDSTVNIETARVPDFPWSGREKELVALLQCALEHIGDDVRGLVNIAQTVRFIDHHEIPRGRMDVPGFVAGELVGAGDNCVRFRLERAIVTLYFAW